MPKGDPIKTGLPDPKKQPQLSGIKDYELLVYSENLKEYCPINITEGYIAVFRLKEHGYLFLYSKKNNMSQKDLSQLLPVIKKFSITLEACITHNAQKKLLVQLEERNKDLNNYAHVVSHDLKSPLRNINTLTSWLRQDHKNVLETGALQYLDLITDNIAKMEDLISGILEYSSLGLKDFNSSEVNLNKLLADLLSHMYTPEHINIEVQGEFPNIQGNAHRFQQVFQNLISNAIKYNDKEKGIVSVGYHYCENQLEFFVKDNGKGIEEKYFKKIFEPFKKLENTKDSSCLFTMIYLLAHLFFGVH
ncbi:MAG: sensor histidine kinase, partial [Flavobacteriaceae bacterium]